MPLCAHGRLLLVVHLWLELSKRDLALETSLSAFWFPGLVIPKVFILKAISVTEFHGPQASHQLGISFLSFPLICTDVFSDIPLTRLLSSIFTQQLQNTARSSVFF